MVAISCRAAGPLLFLLFSSLSALIVSAASVPEARLLKFAERLPSGSNVRRSSPTTITMAMNKRIIKSAERVTHPFGSRKREIDTEGGSFHFHRDIPHRFHRRRPSRGIQHIHGRQKQPNPSVTDTATAPAPTASVTAVGDMNVPMLWNDIMLVVNFEFGEEGSFPLQVDSGSSNTWVAAKTCKKCNDVQMKTIQNFEMQDDCWTLKYGLGQAIVCFGYHDVGFSGFKISNYHLSAAYDIDDHFALFPYCSGIFGIGMRQLAIEDNPTIIDKLVDSGSISSPEIGFWLPPTGQSEMTLGGADPAHWDEASSVTLPNVNPDEGFYKVKLDDVLVNGTSFGFGSREVLMDTGSTYNNAPAADLLQLFTAILGYEPDYWQDQAGKTQVCILPCGPPPGQEYPISFQFGGKQFPMHWLSLVAEPIAKGSSQCFAAATGSMGSGRRWIMGDRFFHNVYHTVNSKTGEVKISKIKAAT